MKTRPVLQLTEIEAARRRLTNGLRLTPCPMAPALSEIAGVRIWLKREDLQRTGSFKERGARNALLCLSASARGRGVVAASAGNHALGLAFHGAQLGIRVTVVVPATAPEVKRARCRALGADVVVYGASFQEAEAHAASLAEKRGATVIHPFDDPRVIAGQGTLALEILDQVPELGTVVVPIGGGGMLAGVAVAIKARRPRVKVIGVEPANAPSFAAARRRGEPVPVPIASTLADGLAVARVGSTTFAIANSLVDDVVTVTENEIARAIAALACGNGAVAEGAGAVPLAAVLAGKIRARSLVLPISGRNIEPRLHERIVAEQAPLIPSSPIQRAA